MYHIVTGVTSNVGVPSTYLVIPPLQQSWRGGILVSHCPSVRPWSVTLVTGRMNSAAVPVWTCYMKYKYIYIYVYSSINWNSSRHSKYLVTYVPADALCISFYMVPTRSLFPGKVLSLKHGCPGPGKVLTFEYLRLKSGKSPCFQSLCQNSNDKHHLALVVFFPSGDNDVKLFGNPSDPLTNHRCRVVWRQLVPAKIPCVSFIKFYYVVAESQSPHAWCHVAIVCSLIGPQSRWYTWCTLCKPSSIVLEIRQHNQDWIPQMNGVYVSCILKKVVT